LLDVGDNLHNNNHNSNDSLIDFISTAPASLPHLDKSYSMPAPYASALGASI
jgi:hypothetical protein